MRWPWNSQEISQNHFKHLIGYNQNDLLIVIYFNTWYEVREGCEIVVVGCGRVPLIPGLLLFLFFILLFTCTFTDTGITFVVPTPPPPPPPPLHSKPVRLNISLVVVLYRVVFFHWASPQKF